MADDRLARIERKLDGLVTEVAELRSATADVTVGQATLEHRFERFGATAEKVDRDWTTVEHMLVDLRGVRGLRSDVERGFAEVVRHLDQRVTPLETTTRQLQSRVDDHEQRLSALENRQRPL